MTVKKMQEAPKDVVICGAREERIMGTSLNISNCPLAVNCPSAPRILKEQCSLVDHTASKSPRRPSAKDRRKLTDSSSDQLHVLQPEAPLRSSITRHVVVRVMDAL